MPVPGVPTYSVSANCGDSQRSELVHNRQPVDRRRDVAAMAPSDPRVPTRPNVEWSASRRATPRSRRWKVRVHGSILGQTLRTRKG